MPETSKPFVTPENMSRIIQRWFENSRGTQILLTDENCEDADFPGIVFSLPEFMAMLQQFDALSEEAKQPTLASTLAKQE